MDDLLKRLERVDRKRFLYGDWTEPGPYTEKEIQEIALRLLDIPQYDPLPMYGEVSNLLRISPMSDYGITPTMRAI